MAVDFTARGLALGRLARSGGTLTGPITGTSNTVDFRSGTSAQTLRVFNTYTDGSNNEWAGIDWNASANVVYIGAWANGSGTLRNTIVRGQTVTFDTGGSSRWFFDNSGLFKAQADLTYTVGAVSSGRPLAVYAGNYASLITSQSGTTYTASGSDSSIIFTSASTVTLTLPAAASFTGRKFHLKTTGGGAVNSASSNVVPLVGGSAAAGILALTAGKWAEIQSDGTNWVIMAAN